MSDVDVVIVAYRSRDGIDGLVQQAKAIPGVVSVVVVDNGDDDSADVAHKAGAVTLRRPDNPGFGVSQNLGVALGDAPYVLLLNPDAVPAAKGIEAGVRHLRQNESVAAVQGAIENRWTGEPERSHGVELGPAHLFGRALGLRRLIRLRPIRAVAARTALRDHVQRKVDVPTPVESMAATVLLVRRTAFESVEGFDDRYFLYGEDLDLCRRLRAAGWQLVALPDTFAVHESGGSSAGWWDRELSWWQGTMQFAARWWTTPRWILGVIASLVRWAGLAVARPRHAARAWTSVVASGLSRERTSV